jgi:heavy metal translocating P-type ATPase
MKTTSKTIDSAGQVANDRCDYDPHSHEHHHHDDHDHDNHDHDHSHDAGKAEYIRLGLMALVVLASLTGWWRPWMSRDWLAFAATLIGGVPIFSEAWENLRKRRMTMELSMTIALLGALSIGQFFTALVIAFFVLFAELLEGLTVGGGRKAIRELIDALPRSVTVRRGSKERELGTHEIAPGETIIIKPGERIPCDGVVSKGSGFVDQASITGESMPSEKVQGSNVFAGTMNKNGVLEVPVERIGRDTTFGKIVEVVEEAETSKAPVQRVADKLAAALVYFALGAAVLTFIVTRNVVSTIAVIIVAGACGVAAGTPLAILAGIGSAARRGIIIKGGLYLEQLSRIDTVVLDKTGTLTLGVPKVTGIVAVNGASEEAILQFAAIAEQHSEHPLGEAIVRSAKERGVSPRSYSDIQYVPGKGIVCTEQQNRIVVGTPALFAEQGIVGAPAGANGDTPGQTSVLVGCNGSFLGKITLADELRAEAREALTALKARGYDTILLTGDSPEAAADFGQRLGVREAIGGLLPEQKLEKIRALMREGRKVAMVGDGVNDAPALVEATVGIAMGQGTDVALESADVTLMTSNLSRLVEVLAIAKRCYRVIMFNFWGTVVVDTIGIVLAFFGQLAPIVAALIHVISELTFILNSARLFRERTR